MNVLDETGVAYLWAKIKELAASGGTGEGTMQLVGSVAQASMLPASARVGDVYNVLMDGMNYVWNGSYWDSLGGTVEATAIPNDIIDQLFTLV